MPLELNLETIALTAKNKEKENISFGNYLMTQEAEKIDKIMHRLNDQITPQIDCLDCGNCCRNLRPVAKNEVLSQFVAPENIEAYKYLKGFACKNLDCNTCTVYQDRPEECRSYPYLDRDRFVDRTYELLQNYEICPIVFNAFEGLKQELKWTYE